MHNLHFLISEWLWTTVMHPKFLNVSLPILWLNSTRMLGLSLLGYVYILLDCPLSVICIAHTSQIIVCLLFLNITFVSCILKSYVEKLSIFLSMAATDCISTRYIGLIMRPNSFIVSNFMFIPGIIWNLFGIRFEGVNKCILVWLLFFPEN